MGNQQPRFLQGSYRDIILNAKFGDGYFWKHPECVNSKVIFTSINPELLESKIRLAPSLFRTGVRIVREAGAKNCFDNAKTLYNIQSLVHPDITEAKEIDKCKLVKYLKISDFGLWYLDDGGFIVRNDAEKYTPRFYLCLGNTCETKKKEERFREKIVDIFGEEYGTIKLNGTNATNKNKIWMLPHRIGYALVQEAKKFLPEFYKYPKNKVQRLSRKGVGKQG